MSPYPFWLKPCVIFACLNNQGVSLRFLTPLPPRALVMSQWPSGSWQQGGSSWQHGSMGQPGSQQWAPTTSTASWSCKLCLSDNLSKGKACKNCRASRTYADAVMTRPPSQQQQQGQQHHGHGQHQQHQQWPPQRNPQGGGTLQQQLTNVVRLMEGSMTGAGTIDAPQGSTPGFGPMAAQAPLTTTASQGALPAGERQALVRQLHQLESSLAALPDTPEFSLLRAQIGIQHAHAKAKIASSRPLGARLDGCRAALDRTRQTATAMAAAAAAAEGASIRAQAQVVSLESELAELEALVTSDEANEGSKTCITRLQSEMMRVVSEMAQSTHVDKPEVDAVMAAMTTLFQGVTDIAMRCQQAAALGTPSLSAEQTPVDMHLESSEADELQQKSRQHLQSMLQANRVPMEPAHAGGA
jgi:hypothetical protein